jgi:putative toxin-antitoxin system antitoxin component (TIGR02293 family)
LSSEILLILEKSLGMNSVKNKPGVLQKKNPPVGRIKSTRSSKTSEKINRVANHKARNALPNEFFKLKDLSGFNNENLAGLLGTTHRTIHNKKNSGEPFDLAQTERLRKLSQFFTEGTAIFGTKNEFKKWLEKPAYGLDYAIPCDLLKQPGGIDKLMDELYAIKFGDTV